ncbi:hypothetical protein RR48_06157 [Papilio machaon]|uniref:Uncharacterized protein n=1 Tax=Papilio machaon TaxID=76193 RepID=A0A194QTM9_PAPMA|nr:hypothetical protein RR48_06157 [Papilio machaon]
MHRIIECTISGLGMLRRWVRLCSSAGPPRTPLSRFRVDDRTMQPWRTARLLALFSVEIDKFRFYDGYIALSMLYNFNKELLEWRTWTQ